MHAHPFAAFPVPRTGLPRARRRASPHRPAAAAASAVAALPEPNWGHGWITRAVLKLPGQAAPRIEPRAPISVKFGGAPPRAPHAGDPRRRGSSRPPSQPSDRDPTAQIHSARSQPGKKMVSAGLFAEEPFGFFVFNPQSKPVDK